MANKKSKAQRQASRGVPPDQTRPKLEQVDSASLVPPSEPSEPTEADVDFATEEKELAKAEAEVKAKRKALGLRKKQAVGGKKLAKRRAFAIDTTDWAEKAAAKLVESVDRANEAVGKLADYEVKLQLPEKEQKAERLAETLVNLTAAREQLTAKS